MSIVKIIIFGNGERKELPVRIHTLSPELQELFLPFAGKTVTWDGGTPQEYGATCTQNKLAA